MAPSSHDVSDGVNEHRTARKCDYRDVAIRDLTSLVLLRERERDTYRALLQLTLSQFHEATGTIHRLQQQIRGSFGRDGKPQHLPPGRAA